MARGWESKSVESQKDDAAAASGRGSRTLSSEERERIRKKEGLELDRIRVRRELDETNSSLRRTSLEAALAYLDGELAKLG